MFPKYNNKKLHNKTFCLICIAECANGGCWGDPHCWTFDTTQFGYQGLCKHVAVKQCKGTSSLPQFEVRFTNIPWRLATSSVSVVSKIEVVIPSWNQTIEITPQTVLVLLCLNYISLKLNELTAYTVGERK